ncbi:MAG TPA: hypothetical protein VHB47_12780 [Thermoanaerobaculia bacterium]|nr:hypothetical protein [Thermoanaerobaculia bacterium]
MVAAPGGHAAAAEREAADLHAFQAHCYSQLAGFTPAPAARVVLAHGCEQRGQEVGFGRQPAISHGAPVVE